MKKVKFLYLFLPLAILLVLGLGGCKREKFDSQMPFMAYVDIPAGMGTVMTYNFPITIGGTGIAMSRAKPLNIRLFIELGEPNFNFVYQAFMEVVKDGVRQEIGYNLNHEPDGRASMTLLPNEMDALDIISQDNFNVVLKLRMRYPTTQASRLRAELTFGVDLL